MNAVADLETIRHDKRAVVLLQHPLRRRILAQARQEPVSATQLAAGFGMPRQRVNYHITQLAKSGFLKPAGKRMKRNLEERQYVASARAYVLSTEVLGALVPDMTAATDRFSAAYLLGLTSLAQQELAAVTEASTRGGVRVLTLSMTSAIRLKDAAQRAAFGKALTEAVADVVARYTEPNEKPDHTPGEGRPYRLFLGCYPIIEQTSETTDE